MPAKPARGTARPALFMSRVGTTHTITGCARHDPFGLGAERTREEDGVDSEEDAGADTWTVRLWRAMPPPRRMPGWACGQRGGRREEGGGDGGATVVGDWRGGRRGRRGWEEAAKRQLACREKREEGIGGGSGVAAGVEGEEGGGDEGGSGAATDAEGEEGEERGGGGGVGTCPYGTAMCSSRQRQRQRQTNRHEGGRREKREGEVSRGPEMSRWVVPGTAWTCRKTVVGVR